MVRPPAKRAHTEHMPTIAPGITEVDPRGDIVLRIGTTDARLMRVSSKHVSTISKVFEAMLSPNWLEGQTTYSAESPLALPEDSPEDMEILLRLAHFKIHNLDQIPSDRLPGLLICCDKYDCFEVFRFWLDCVRIYWYHGLRAEKDVSTLLQGVCIAHVFDDSKQFSELIDRLYDRASENDIKACMESGLCTIMPTRFRGE